MREILLIIRGNLRKSRSSCIGIAIMMFIVSLSLTSVLSIVINTGRRDYELMESTGMGNIIAAMMWDADEESYEEYISGCNELSEQIALCDDVESVEQISTLYLNVSKINGEESDGVNTCFVYDIQTPGVQYNIYDEKENLLENFALGAGEIAVPVSFKAIYGIGLGDTITLSVISNDDNQKNAERTYTIAAYIEDPYMGSSVIGIKTLLMSAEGMELYNAEKSESNGIVISIFKADASSMTDTEFATMLNRETAYGSRAMISLTYTQANSYMTMLTNVFSVVIIAFVFMLVIATMIIINHNISSSIEQDFVNLGILKAMGVTNKKIKTAVFAEYLSVGICGAILQPNF